MSSNPEIILPLASIFCLLCLCFAAGECGKKRYKQVLCWLFPPGLLLMYGFYSIAERERDPITAEAPSSPCKSGVERPPWLDNGSVSPQERLPDELILDAVGIAQRILLARDLPLPDYSVVQQDLRSTAWERIPDLIDQRGGKPDRTAHRLERENRGAGRVAESYPSSSRKICLYIDEISERFRKNGLESIDSQATYLAFILIHELCHIPRECGGLFHPEVPGDPADASRLAPQAHIGLHRWIADLACWFLRSQANSVEESKGAMARLATQREVLDPEGAYGKELIRHRNGGKIVKEGPSGPPFWYAAGPVASDCGH